MVALPDITEPAEGAVLQMKNVFERVRLDCCSSPVRLCAAECEVGEFVTRLFPEFYTRPHSPKRPGYRYRSEYHPRAQKVSVDLAFWTRNSLLIPGKL